MNARQNSHRPSLLPPAAGSSARVQALETAVRQASAELARTALGRHDRGQSLQPLEPRRLMSAAGGSFFDGTTFSLEGDTTQANRMSIELDADATHMRGVVNGNEGQWVAMKQVRRVEVSGGDGDDVIRIDSRLQRSSAQLSLASIEQIRIAPVLDGRNSGGRTQLAEARQLRSEVREITSAPTRVLAATGSMDIDVKEGQTGAFVESVTLIDADTDQPIGWVSDPADGFVLDLPELSSGRRLNLEAHLADAGGHFAGSVRFELGEWAHTENYAPFAVFGDNDGDFNGWKVTPGEHTLTATAYSERGGTGTAGSTMKMTFTVIDSSVKEKPQNPAVQPVMEDERPAQERDLPVADDRTAGDETAPDAVIEAVQTQIAAGQSLHVSALATRLHHGEWNDASFEWNFGDAGSEFNDLRGFVAAHLYEKPGTYTVTLRVTDESGRVGVEKLSVTVTAAARRQIYVDASGNDSNNGSSGQPVRTAARAMALLRQHGDHAEILFRRGQSHSVGSTMYIEQDDVVIGAYGAGAKPKLTWAGGLERKHIMIQSATSQQQLMVRDLAFDAPGPDTTDKGNRPSAFSPRGKGGAFVNNTLYDIGNGVNANGRPTGLLVQGNNAPKEVGLREYFVWGEGEQLTILGNTAINSTREHIVRLSGGGAHGVTISGNDFTNLDRRAHDGVDYDKNVITMQVGSFGYVTDNRINGWTMVGPLGDRDGLNSKDARWNWAIWENNHFTYTTMSVEHGAQHVDIRYNLFEFDDAWSIQVHGYNHAYDRTNTDITVHGNVAINNGKTGQFLHVYSGALEIEVTENTFIAPNLEVGPYQTAALAITASDLSSFSKIDGNLWPDVANTSSWAKGGMVYFGTGNESSDFWCVEDWNALPGVGEDSLGHADASALSLAVLNSHGVPMSMAA